MKIDLAKNRDALLVKISEITGGRKMAGEVLDALVAFSETHLHCSVCDNMLPKEAFYVQKANKARGGRGTVCRACFRKAYPTT